MISYFIVERFTFLINLLIKLKYWFQVIFGLDSFPLKMSPFQVNLFRTLRAVYLLMDGGMPAFNITFFLQKRFPSLLASARFVVRYFSFVEQTVLVVFLDYSFVTTKFPIFFFIGLQMIAFEYFQYDLILDISE